MKEVLIKVGDVISALIATDEIPCEVSIGRANFTRPPSTADNYCIIDYLSAVNQGVYIQNESESRATNILLKYQFTILFIGDNASNLAFLIQNKLHNSDDAYNLQRQHGIRIGNVSSVRNIRELDGNIYNDAFELETVVQYAQRRVDTAIPIETIDLQVDTQNKTIIA